MLNKKISKICCLWNLSIHETKKGFAVLQKFLKAFSTIYASNYRIYRNKNLSKIISEAEVDASVVP